MLEAAAGRAADDRHHEPGPQRGRLVEQLRDRAQQHVGRLERLDPAGEEQHVRVRGQAEVGAGAGLVERAEHVEVDAGVHDLDAAGVGVVQVDQLLGLEVGVRDEHVGGLDDLLLADDPGDRLGGVPVGERVVLDLGHRVHRVHQRDAPAVAGQGADLAGEPVVGVDGVVVAERLRRLGAQHLAGEDAQLPGQLALGQPLERAGVDVVDQHPVRGLDHGRQGRAGRPGEDVDLDALLREPSGQLDDVDVHAPRVPVPGWSSGEVCRLIIARRLMRSTWSLPSSAPPNQNPPGPPTIPDPPKSVVPRPPQGCPPAPAGKTAPTRRLSPATRRRRSAPAAYLLDRPARQRGARVDEQRQRRHARCRVNKRRVDARYRVNKRQVDARDPRQQTTGRPPCRVNKRQLDALPRQQATGQPAA